MIYLFLFFILKKNINFDILKKYMLIIADNKIPYLKGVLDPYADIKYLSTSEFTNENIKHADILIIRSRVQCNAGLLNNTKVRLITAATIGFDNIDTDYCNAKNIMWKNSPGCNSSSVAQYITSTLLHLGKKYDFLLKDKTIGIIGVGNVGSKVEKSAKILGMEVLLNDPPRARTERNEKFLPLDEICRKADIITIHVPLNKSGIDKTYHLFDENMLSGLKKDVFFINTSRGAVVDNQALKKAIKSGKTAGTVLDVWENEPDIDSELLSMVDYATPHIAGYSDDGKANGASMCVQAVSRFLGFGLDNWYPDEIEKPDNTVISIDCSNRKEQDIIFEAVRATYDIEKEDKRLRNSPETFEKQRIDYPIRREFPAYTVELKNTSSELINKIKQLGFKIR